MENGREIPIIGLGTYNTSGGETKESVRTALETGYTHIDTAEGYQNEAEIGEVLREYDREKIFLTSKVLPSNLHYESVLESCEASLEKLNTSYLDLYLIHWPNPTISLRETLSAMEKLREEGRVRAIGVSNFSLYQLRIALKISNVPICVNQVEFHPWYNQNKLLSFCRERNVVVTASAPLGRTQVLQDELVQDLAKEYGKTPAQITLKWEIQKDIVTIPGSTSEEHIKQNFRILDWELDPGDMKRLDEIPKSSKCYNLSLDSEVYGIPS
ncbi:oxidoreductase [candidate division MSBL1 archaeon SCGC-AAA259E17]|uniref:Oxidoreductase n=1 Tax=candidate division MSBL1 archaeon SCGC-AAA259E17 TaxID=1698263 RepID=A0A133UAC6_9EURY|nr:oxidoreductase [candidate division MSBL1 archaeon SCGC-AAA259E17]